MNDTRLSLGEIRSLIASHPALILFNSEEIEHLSLLTKTQHVNAGVNITTEGEIIDHICFIAAGSADVNRSIATVKGKEITHVSHLIKGDAIGLSDNGFFALSRPGLRTATVTSITDMVLIALSISDLYDFLRRSTNKYPDLKNSCEKILLMNFIKKSNLFINLSNDKIEQLSRKITKILVSAGEMIFLQGDKADKCYFILNGTISILAAKKDGEHVIATLEKSNMFGEGAFLDIPIRNASARVETNCELFVCENNIEDIIEHTTKPLNLKRLEQLRPMKNLEILLKEKTTNEGDKLLILNNPTLNLSKALSVKEHLVWDHISNDITLLDISKVTNIPLTSLYKILFSFNKNGFVEIPLLAPEPWFKRIINKISMSKK